MTASAQFRYTKNARLRMRLFKPWHAAMVYTADAPALHWINSTTWLILELCEERTEDDIAADVATVLEKEEEIVRADVRSALIELEQKGLIMKGPVAAAPERKEVITNGS